MEELLCSECREKVIRRIAQRGAGSREEMAYKEAVALKAKAEALMHVLEKKVF